MVELKHYIIRTKTETDLDNLLIDVAKWGVVVEHVYRRVFYGFSAPLTYLNIETITNDTRIDIIEEAASVKASVKQNNAPWHLDRIDQIILPLSGSYTYDSDGSGVIAYVLDSGCVFFDDNKASSDSTNFDHVEFNGRVSPINELDGGGIPLTDVAFDPIYNRLQILDPENSRLSAPRGFDHFGHGTHVAGLIASQTYGVAKNVTVRTAKVLDIFGNGITSDVIAGVEAILADFENNTTIGQPAICNMSLGTVAPISPEPAGGFELSVQALVDAGITVIVAAGNSGQSANNVSPARMDSVITVGATGRIFDSQGVMTGDIIANFSNFGDSESIDAEENFGFGNSTASNTGSAVDMFAPGVNIVSTYNDGPTAVNTFSGTSMATPIVAGVAILALQNNTTLTPSNVSALLIANSVNGIISGVPIGTSNRMIYSTFVDHVIEWLTPAGDLGSFPEGFELSPLVDLDAIGFSGQLVSYTVSSGTLPNGIIINSTTGILEGVVQAVSTDTVFNFDIRASDSDGFVDRSFSLTIINNGLSPLWLTASDLFTIQEGTILNIQLSAISQLIPANPTLTYTVIDIITDAPTTLPNDWSLSSAGLLTGTAPIVVNDDHIITFKVRAQDGAVFSDRIFTLTVTQSIASSPPVWQTNTDLGIIVRFESVSIQLLATDVDGLPLPIKYKTVVTTGDGPSIGVDNLPQGLILNESTGEITGAFTGKTTDGVVVDPTIFDDATTTFDSDTLTFESEVSIFEFQIFAEDGAHVVGKTFFLTILNVPANEPVEWVTPSSNLGMARALQFNSFAVLAKDNDFSPRVIKYAVISGNLPTSMFLHVNTGIISGIPANFDEKERTSVFEIQANDGLSFVTRTFAITVLRVNKQPEWITPAGALISQINEGESFSFQLVATDPNSDDVLQYRVVNVLDNSVKFDNNTTTFDGDTTTITDNIDVDANLPDGLSLNLLTGVIWGRIDDVSEDTLFEFTVRVDDSITNGDEALFADRLFSITVVDGALNINQAPIWITPAGALSDGIENEQYRHELLTTDFDGPDPLRYIVSVGQLPEGLTLNITTGVISGIPTDSDLLDTTSFFTIQVSDGVKISDRAFNIKIIDAAIVDLAPVWVTPSGSIGSFNELTSMIFAVQANDPEGDNVTYTDLTNSLPTGLIITIGGIINGTTPQVSSNQIFNFIIEATDEQSNTTPQSFSMIVNDVPNVPPVWVTGSALGSFEEIIPLTVILIATDADSGPLANLVYIDTSGSVTHLAAAPVGATLGLPPGLVLSSSGVISGSTTVTSDTVYSFEISVDDGAASVPEQFVLTITEQAALPNERSSLIVRLTGDQRIEFQSWNTNALIFDSELFSSELLGFGRNIEPDIYILNNIHTVNPTDISNIFGLHHATFNVLLGQPLSAVSRDINGNITHEVIYLNILDPQIDASNDIVVTTNIYDDDGNIIDTIDHISKNFDNLRLELLGLSNNDVLPTWMSSEQILDDPTSVIGYIPSIVLAYVKTGLSEEIINRLNVIEAINEILPINETTFDDTIVFGDTFSPTVTPGNVLTIQNGVLASPVDVTFNAPGTLTQIVIDINNAVIDGVIATARIIEIFVPDSPPATYPGTFQTGVVLTIAYDQETIEFSGTAFASLGLPAITQETGWSQGATFDNTAPTELVINRGPGLTLTGRRVTIDRYLFDDNADDFVVETTFDADTTTLDGPLSPTSFDFDLTSVKKWIKFNADIDYPNWITQKGTLYGFLSGETVSIQLQTNNYSGAIISYSLIYGTLPDGVTMNSGGLINGIIPLIGSIMVNHYFVVRAIDTIGNYYDRGFSIKVNGITTFDNAFTTFTDSGNPMTLDVT